MLQFRATYSSSRSAHTEEAFAWRSGEAPPIKIPPLVPVPGAVASVESVVARSGSRAVG